MTEPNSDTNTDLALDEHPDQAASAAALSAIDASGEETPPQGQPSEEATNEELGVESPDTPGLSEQPAEEAAEATEETLYEDDKALLEAHGIEGHETVQAYLQSQKDSQGETNNDFGEFMEVAKQALGYEGKPESLKEFTQDLMDHMMKNGAGADEKTDDSSQSDNESASALDIDGFFKKYDSLPGDDKPFYQDFANTVSAAAQKGQAEVQSQLGKLTTQSDMLLDMTWYNEAVRSAGDDAVPPFAEARALLASSGDVRAQAQFRLERFGTAKNPYLQTFKTWAGSKTPSGLTKAETITRDANAQKVRGYKSLLKPTPATRATTVPFSSLSPSDQAKELGQIEG